MLRDNKVLSKECWQWYLHHKKKWLKKIVLQFGLSQTYCWLLPTPLEKKLPMQSTLTGLSTPLTTLFPRFWLSKNFHFDAFECVQIALRSRSDRFRRVFCVENVGDRCQRSKHGGNVPPSLPGAGAAWRCLLSHMIKKIAKFVSLFLYFVNRVLEKEKK